MPQLFSRNTALKPSELLKLLKPYVSSYMAIAFIFFFVLTFQHDAIGQLDSMGRFAEVDMRVRDMNIRERDPVEIAIELTEDLYTAEDKVRAIYIWITENFEYSFYTYEYQKENKRERKIKTKDPDEEAAFYQDLRDEDLDKFIRRRGGVVADFTYLFKVMCEAIDIEAGEIKGYLRLKERRIGQMPRRATHSWNWAVINGKKYLFDTMLGAGYIGKNKETRQKEFFKDFNELYFMANPALLILDHFPLDSTYQLLNQPISQEEFARQPLPKRGFSAAQIIDFEPKSGLIPSDAQFIDFKFKFPQGVDPHRILIFERRKLSDQNFIKEGEWYVLKYQIPELRPSMLIITVKDSKFYEHESLVFVLEN